MFEDLGLLILRLVVGLLFVGHGSQKLFGWFGGFGLEGTAGWLGSMGFRPPHFWATIAGLSELVGGLLLALGLLNPLGALGIIASMLIAIAKVHWPKLWVTEGGFEYPLTLIAGVTAISLAGPGLYSLDAKLGTGLPMPAVFVAGLAVVIIGAMIALTSAAAAAPAAAPVTEEREEREKEERRAA